MSIRIHREQRHTSRKRLALNESTDALDMREFVRVRRVHTLEIDGERYTQAELKSILRAAKRCQCGECIDCQVASACKRSGWK